jgi:hypothetical protein
LPQAAGAAGILEKREILAVIAVKCFHGCRVAAAIVGQARQFALFAGAAGSD